MFICFLNTNNYINEVFKYDIKNLHSPLGFLITPSY